MDCLIQSPEKYADILPIFCSQHFKYNMINRIFIATSSKRFCTAEQISVDINEQKRIEIIRLPRDMDYASNMLYALKLIQNEIIFHCCEDHIIELRPDIERINQCYDIMLSDPNVGHFRLNSKESMKFSTKNDLYGEVNNRYSYLFSLQPALFRVKYLQEILRDGESAWLSENQGSKRAKLVSMRRLCATQTLFPSSNFFTRGKMITQNYVRFAKQCNLGLPELPVQQNYVRKTDSDEPHKTNKIGIYCSSKNPELWPLIYSHFSCDNIDFDICFVGPNPPAYKLPENLQYIQSNVKPTQCWFIGGCMVRGNFLLNIPDDIIFKLGSLKELDNLIQTMSADSIDIVAPNYRNSPMRRLRKDIDSPAVPTCMLISRFLFDAIGIDNQFIGTFWDVDFALVALQNGSNLITVPNAVCDDPIQRCKHHLHRGYNDREYLMSKWYKDEKFSPRTDQRMVLQWTDEVLKVSQGRSVPGFS